MLIYGSLHDAISVVLVGLGVDGHKLAKEIIENLGGQPHQARLPHKAQH